MSSEMTLSPQAVVTQDSIRKEFIVYGRPYWVECVTTLVSTPDWIATGDMWKKCKFKKNYYPKDILTTSFQYQLSEQANIFKEIEEQQLKKWAQNNKTKARFQNYHQLFEKDLNEKLNWRRPKYYGHKTLYELFSLDFLLDYYKLLVAEKNIPQRFSYDDISIEKYPFIKAQKKETNYLEIFAFPTAIISYLLQSEKVKGDVYVFEVMLPFFIELNKHAGGVDFDEYIDNWAQRLLKDVQ